MRIASRADRLIENILSAAGNNLFGHIALLNALDLRLRAAEIVITGDAPELVQAALKQPYLERIVLRASPGLPASHPAQEKMKARAVRRHSFASASAARCR